jgi:OmpA-OmpF porin, OOP family
MANFNMPLLLACFWGLSQMPATAQNGAPLPPSSPAYNATPAHMWEFGLHAGAAMGFTDIDVVPNWGAGFHFRRALDYVFSIRGEALYSVLKNEDRQDGATQTDFQSGSLQMLVSFSNLRWTNKRTRMANFYGFAGGGVNHFKVKVVNRISPQLAQVDAVQTHADLGVGIAFRLSDRFNIGFETKASMLFGKNADRLDGIDRQDNDIFNYSSVRLNFNIGNKDKLSEPLYWVNPMDVILNDVSELKKRKEVAMTDSDGDGVIDFLDQDSDTPPNVTVDTRGIPLDSDADGVPNYLDDEPFLNPEKVAVQKGQPTYPTSNEVRSIVREEMGNSPGTGTGAGAGSLANWFLPMIHFNIDSDKIRYADYGNLASIAKVMKNNPNLRVVVTGFTDKTASDTYNLDLSFKRAKTAITHLVNVHGIPRSRLILNYNGEEGTLVPTYGSTIMNRRVEFQVASGNDVDMENPVPVSEKNGKKRGY